MRTRAHRYVNLCLLLAISSGLIFLPSAAAAPRYSDHVHRSHARLTERHRDQLERHRRQVERHRRQLERHRRQLERHRRQVEQHRLQLARHVATVANTAASWSGDFSTGDISRWRLAGGGAQCANYRVPSSGYHQRGNLFVDSAVTPGSGFSARFDLPGNVAPYSTSVCELLHLVPMGLGTDRYYSYMFYVPPGWTPGTTSFWGVETAQIHFQGIWGAPVSFELHGDHMTLALETGSCTAIGTPHNTGCDWRSQADLASGPNLPPYYVIPPGAFTPGSWYEIAMRVHWAADNSGQIQTWYRQQGQPTWNQSVNYSGHPTVQWVRGGSCCAVSAVDKIGAYRGFATTPTSVWLDNFTTASSLAAVVAAMP
jgi:hypothetical protein